MFLLALTLAFIGWVWLRYFDMFDHILVSIFFLGMLGSIHPVLAFDGPAVLLTTLGHIVRYKIHLF
jgi:hypothetical protein